VAIQKPTVVIDVWLGGSQDATAIGSIFALHHTV
jgi:hypothetical protein